MKSISKIDVFYIASYNNNAVRTWRAPLRMWKIKNCWIERQERPLWDRFLEVFTKQVVYKDVNQTGIKVPTRPCVLGVFVQFLNPSLTLAKLPTELRLWHCLWDLHTFTEKISYCGNCRPLIFPQNCKNLQILAETQEIIYNVLFSYSWAWKGTLYLHYWLKCNLNCLCAEVACEMRIIFLKCLKKTKQKFQVSLASPNNTTVQVYYVHP